MIVGALISPDNAQECERSSEQPVENNSDYRRQSMAFTPCQENLVDAPVRVHPNLRQPLADIFAQYPTNANITQARINTPFPSCAQTRTTELTTTSRPITSAHTSANARPHSHTSTLPVDDLATLLTLEDGSVHRVSSKVAALFEQTVLEKDKYKRLFGETCETETSTLSEPQGIGSTRINAPAGNSPVLEKGFQTDSIENAILLNGRNLHKQQIDCTQPISDISIGSDDVWGRGNPPIAKLVPEGESATENSHSTTEDGRLTGTWHRCTSQTQVDNIDAQTNASDVHDCNAKNLKVTLSCPVNEVVENPCEGSEPEETLVSNDLSQDFHTNPPDESDSWTTIGSWTMENSARSSEPNNTVDRLTKVATKSSQDPQFSQNICADDLEPHKSHSQSKEIMHSCKLKYVGRQEISIHSEGQTELNVKICMQRDDQLIRDFTSEWLATLSTSRQPLSTEQQIDLLHKNMKQDLQLLVRRQDVRSIDEFIRCAEGAEQFLRSRRSLLPPEVCTCKCHSAEVNLHIMQKCEHQADMKTLLIKIEILEKAVESLILLGKGKILPEHKSRDESDNITKATWTADNRLLSCRAEKSHDVGCSKLSQGRSKNRKRNHSFNSQEVGNDYARRSDKYRPKNFDRGKSDKTVSKVNYAGNVGNREIRRDHGSRVTSGNMPDLRTNGNLRSSQTSLKDCRVHKEPKGKLPRTKSTASHFSSRTREQGSSAGSTPYGDSQSAVIFSGKCWNCDVTGHRASMCPEPRILKCYTCKLEGFKRTNCPKCRQHHGAFGLSTSNCEAPGFHLRGREFNKLKGLQLYQDSRPYSHPALQQNYVREELQEVAVENQQICNGRVSKNPPNSEQWLGNGQITSELIFDNPVKPIPADVQSFTVAAVKSQIENNSIFGTNVMRIGA